MTRAAWIPALLMLTGTALAEPVNWPDWRSRYALAEGFDISVLSVGFEDPVALSPSILPPLVVFERSGARRSVHDPADVQPGQPSPSVKAHLGEAFHGDKAAFPASYRKSYFTRTEAAILRRDASRRTSPFVEWRGEGPSAIRDFCFGGRGLLLLVEDPELGGAVLEVRYRPAYEYPWRVGHEPRVRDAKEAAGHAVMAHAGCFSCHSLHGRRQLGPSLDRETLVDRLAVRLDSQDYRDRVARLDEIEEWSMRKWREERAEVLAAEGINRLRIWMRWHLVEPSFDNLQARMPSMGLDAEQIEIVAEFLLASDPD